jgi:hypothetical protein
VLFETLSKTKHKSIRPAQQLAYLALVTAADENQAAPSSQAQISDADRLPTQKTADSDETLVDDDAMDGPRLSPIMQGVSTIEPLTVLGKRTSQDRDGAGTTCTTPFALLSPTESTSTRNGDRLEEMSSPNSRPMVRLRSRSTSAQIFQSGPTSPQCPPDPSELPTNMLEADTASICRGEPRLEDGQPMTTEASNVVDANVMTPALAKSPPTLPPRSGSMSINANMMFGTQSTGIATMRCRPADVLTSECAGQQHDVAECMDNILFQIEASLDETKIKCSDGESKNLLKS